MSILISRRAANPSSSVQLPASKSLSNRLLIIRALSGARFRIHNLSEADDTRIMQEALSSGEGRINVGHAGTAMRFLTAYYAAAGRTVTLTGSARMQHRPIGVLADALRRLGAGITYLGKEGYPPLKIIGKPLKSYELTVSADISSQYISALLMIAPLTAPDGLTLNLTGQVGSRPYIDMTLGLLSEFGIQYEKDGNRIHIREQPFVPKDYRVESDWSAASYWYGLSAVLRDCEVRLPELFRVSLQGDSRVAELMKGFGIETIYESDAVVIRPGGQAVEYFEADFTDCPDLAQTIAATGAALGVGYRLTGLRSLRIKETDRIAAMQTELQRCGFAVSAEGDVLKHEASGSRPFAGGEQVIVRTYDDHRMALSLAIVGAAYPGRVRIENPSVVSKSYPRFWDDLRVAGFGFGG